MTTGPAPSRRARLAGRAQPKSCQAYQQNLPIPSNSNPHLVTRRLAPKDCTAIETCMLILVDIGCIPNHEDGQVYSFYAIRYWRLLCKYMCPALMLLGHYQSEVARQAARPASPTNM